ncbi:PREDICTED: uncharacterized protein LOC109168223 [Ipomoea nil]|uniref:uncharacterized protein LOC109168223 n=1 Tax=Ipomoea nil TaxID=35883 RepID=UPI00090107C8|nr:PREDICTED: uncharacterized protein LOC109168223 [Ipomoea nil]
MGEIVSAVLQKKLPPKCKDPGMFTIPCKIGSVNVERAMLDLGASINVMPLSIYSSLNIGSLKETGVIVQLADRSNVYPVGVLEDVLVQVDGLIFPANFYVLDMEEDNSTNSSLILLGRPFLKTSRTKIDVHDGTLTMEFDGELIKFNIYNAMKYPDDVSSVSLVDVVDPFVQKISYLTYNNSLEVALNLNLTPDGLKKIINKFSLNFDLQDIVHELESLKPMKYNAYYIELPISDTKLLPSVVQAPKIELKPLPDHLKYAFLGDEETLPVLISKKLSTLEEDGFSGFHQIPVAPGDQEKMTFTCPFGTLAFWWMPFGLCNAPATFQRCMVSIFSDFVEIFIEVFMDDFTVYGDSFDACLANLTKVLERLIVYSNHAVLKYLLSNKEAKPRLACRGHFGPKRIARKALECGLFWPSLFRDCYMFCKTCAQCQKTGNLGYRDQMPLTPILVCEIFDV